MFFPLTVSRELVRLMPLAENVHVVELADQEHTVTTKCFPTFSDLRHPTEETNIICDIQRRSHSNVL